MDYVEIYHTESTTEARKILDVVLRPNGIEAVLHDRTDHAFPAPAAQPGAIFIAVPLRQREEAERLIREAKADGYL